MAAAPGNQYAAKAKVISDRLRKICVQEDFKRVDEGLQKMLDAAALGSKDALEIIITRLEGKPAQGIDITSGGEPLVPVVDENTRAAKMAAIVARAKSRSKAEPTVADLLGEE